MIDFEIHQKNLSFREAVMALAQQYQISIQIENENKKNDPQAKITHITNSCENFQKILKQNFFELPPSPVKKFLETHFKEAGFLESINIFKSWQSNAIHLPNTIDPKISFYSFPFQTERNEIFGFLFTQLEMEKNLEIPIEMTSFKVVLWDQFQNIINFSTARRQNHDKSYVVTTSLFDLFFLVKNNIKNTVFVDETAFKQNLYLFFSKYGSKIFLLLPENYKNIAHTHDRLSILIRWVPKNLSEKIKLYKNLKEEMVMPWLLNSQKTVSSLGSVTLPRELGPRELGPQELGPHKQGPRGSHGLTGGSREEPLDPSVKPRDDTEPLGPSVKPRDDTLDLFYKTSRFYHQILLHPSHSHILKYLQSRGISVEDIKEWKLGFCPKENILTRVLFKQNIDLNPFIQLGLLRPSQKAKRNYDFFNGRIVFPIVNHSGNIVAMGGRIFDDENQKAPKYINSPESHLFSKSHILFNFFAAANAIVEKGYALVVEGYMDCITLSKNGIKNTIAVMGTALTSEHLSSLSHITKRIILCFDADHAGKLAIKRSFIANFKFPELILDTIELQNAKDPDEFVRMRGVELFIKLIDNHVNPVYQNVIQWIQNQSYDDHDFISKLRSEFKYVEFPFNSSLGTNLSTFLLQNYNIPIESVFDKNKLAINYPNISSIDQKKIRSKAHVPLWSLHNPLELKILFSFFYCHLSDLPIKFRNVLEIENPKSYLSKNDIFHNAFINQISDVGKKILKELFFYCKEKNYRGCYELCEGDVFHLSEHSKLFAAYSKKFVLILVNAGLEYLFELHDPEFKNSIFNTAQVWSPQNKSFLRLQCKNAQLSSSPARLIESLMEFLTQLEIDEIDSQLKAYSKTHFNHDIKEKIKILVQSRITRQLLFNRRQI